MGTVAYVGQAIFAPWTLPGQPFSVDPDYNSADYEEKYYNTQYYD